MRKYCLLICSLLSISPLYAEIYKWVDNNGVVHFTDKPHANSESVNVPGAEQNTLTPINETITDTQSAVASEQDYSISIIQPKDQETIRNNQGYVPVLLQVEPELKSGYKLQLLFDGAPVGAPQIGSVFDLRDVNRGAHTLAVKIIDSQAEEITMSKKVSFFMFRPTVGMTHKPPTTPGAP